MPPNVDPMVQALIERGLLATGGNIRNMPFADPSGLANGNAASSSPPVPTATGGTSVRPSGPTPVMDANKQLVDPTTGAPLDPQLANEWLKYLVAGAAVGGGYALTDAIRDKFAKGRIPTVEGEVVNDPLGALPNSADDAIISGEYSDVAPAQLESPRKALTNGSTETGSETAKAIAERKGPTRKITRGNSRVISSADSLSDLSPEELQQAKDLTAQLVANRTAGNKARAKQSNLNRRGGRPTGPTDEEGLLNTVVRIMRENGAIRSLAKAVP